MNDYKPALVDAYSLIAAEALAQARREVPKAKNVKLGEFENLPPAVRKKIIAKSQLVVDTQYQDLEKSIFFQFQSSHDASDSWDQLESDLMDAGESYVTGASVSSGAGIAAAQLVNDARSAFFYDDQTLEQIDGFVFVNGDPVTEICQDLAGTVFAKDDPGADQYQPPLHWNCKSSIQAILKGNLDDALKKAGQDDVVPLEPSTAALKKQIQFQENCSDHLHIGKDHFVRELVGADQSSIKCNEDRVFENGYELRVKRDDGSIVVYGKLKTEA
jgi:hypothetical protein